MEDILAEWQTAWDLTRRRVTQRLVWFQAVCKGLAIIISRLKVKPLGSSDTAAISENC